MPPADSPPPERRRQDVSLREPWPTGRKNRAPLAVLALPRRSGFVAASAHEGAASRATPSTLPYSARPPRKFAPRGFSCDRNGQSLRLAAQDVLPPSGELSWGARRESTGQVAAAGRETWHARSTDGNRVRKRSEHAAAVSTMALRIAVSGDDCWLSSGSPQAACASSAQALEDAVAMPAVYGPQTRFARCDLTTS